MMRLTSSILVASAIVALCIDIVDAQSHHLRALQQEECTEFGPDCAGPDELRPVNEGVNKKWFKKYQKKYRGRKPTVKFCGDQEFWPINGNACDDKGRQYYCMFGTAWECEDDAEPEYMCVCNPRTGQFYGCHWMEEAGEIDEPSCPQEKGAADKLEAALPAADLAELAPRISELQVDGIMTSEDLLLACPDASGPAPLGGDCDIPSDFPCLFGKVNMRGSDLFTEQCSCVDTTWKCESIDLGGAVFELERQPDFEGRVSELKIEGIPEESQEHILVCPTGGDESPEGEDCDHDMDLVCYFGPVAKHGMDLWSEACTCGRDSKWVCRPTGINKSVEGGIERVVDGRQGEPRVKHEVHIFPGKNGGSDIPP